MEYAARLQRGVPTRAPPDIQASRCRGRNGDDCGNGSRGGSGSLGGRGS